MRRLPARTAFLAVFAGAAASVSAQTATMPPHASVFNGNTRGYFFTAPADFRITGIQVLLPPGSTNTFTNYAVVRFDGNTPPPAFPAVTNAFQQLGLGLNQPAGSFLPVSIDVHAGEVIGVYGNSMPTSGATTGTNSYTAATPQGSTTIMGNVVPLSRSGMQFHLGSTTSPQGMHDLWTEAASSAISRVEFTYAPIGVSGACCLPNGNCISTSQAGCTSSGGAYQGDNILCQNVQCPQPPTGRCCTFGGSCSVVTAAACAASGGTYGGNGTTCAAGCPGVPPVAYTNCNLPTGTTTLSGVAAPAASQWSEVARDETDATTANTTAGFGGTGALRLADDFVVGPGGLNLAFIKFPAYLTGSTTVTATAMTIQIWNGPPNDPNSTVIFGDTTTNRLANAEFSNFYRCFNTVTPPVCAGAVTVADTNRRIQWMYGTVNTALAAGTYWIDVNYTGCSFSPCATQSDAIGRQCNPNNANALQFNAAWVALNDAGQGCAPTPVQQDLYFELLGTSGSSCYANCDGSTTVPFLNVLDFNCFLNRFSAGASYANCDNSTTPPVLNVLDFNCFLNRFSAGCSAP